MSREDEKWLQCYNTSCGKQYKESENLETSCVYHTGVPVFHDAYKGWSCCRKRTTDFTEFLGIQGCAVGCHSNVKPPEPERPNKVEQETTVCHKPVVPRDISERPSDNLPMTTLRQSVLPSLNLELEKALSETSENQESITDQSESAEVPVGTNCKNAGCRYVYKDVSSKYDKCLYHPGVPIFHEGMKYWACCQRKTSDFETFLSQEGCETGNHLWFKPKNENQSEDPGKTCRFDWHQTADTVVITIYSKLPNPQKSKIQANSVKINILVVFSVKEKVFSKEMILYNPIEVGNSFVEFTPSKVEVSLKKKESVSWPKLCF